MELFLVTRGPFSKKAWEFSDEIFLCRPLRNIEQSYYVDVTWFFSFLTHFVIYEAPIYQLYAGCQSSLMKCHPEIEESS